MRSLVLLLAVAVAVGAGTTVGVASATTRTSVDVPVGGEAAPAGERVLVATGAYDGDRARIMLAREDARPQRLDAFQPLVDRLVPRGILDTTLDEARYVSVAGSAELLAVGSAQNVGSPEAYFDFTDLFADQSEIWAALPGRRPVVVARCAWPGGLSLTHLAVDGRAVAFVGGGCGRDRQRRAAAGVAEVGSDGRVTSRVLWGPEDAYFSNVRIAGYIVGAGTWHLDGTPRDPGRIFAFDRRTGAVVTESTGEYDVGEAFDVGADGAIVQLDRSAARGGYELRRTEPGATTPRTLAPACEGRVLADGPLVVFRHDDGGTCSWTILNARTGELRPLLLGRRETPVAIDGGRIAVSTRGCQGERIVTDTIGGFAATPISRVSCATSLSVPKTGVQVRDDGALRLALRCPAGCAARLRLVLDGRRIRFDNGADELAAEAQRGGRVSVPATLSSRALAMLRRARRLRVRVEVLVAGTRRVTPLTLVAPRPRDLAGRRCLPSGSLTLAISPAVRVFASRSTGAVTACLFATGIRRRLWSENLGVAPVALRGFLVAFSPPGRIAVRDMVTGRLTLAAEASPGYDASVDSVVLGADGALAWIACPYPEEGFGPRERECAAASYEKVQRTEVWTLTGDRRTLLDAGVAVRLGSLRVEPGGRRVSWVRGGRRVVARLTP